MTDTMSPEVIARLTPERFQVTQRGGTEHPGTGEHLDGIQAAGYGEYLDLLVEIRNDD
jgi:peptide methionine sulfoxide reductase MsrB